MENSSLPSSRMAMAHMTIKPATRVAFGVTFAAVLIADHFDRRSALGPYSRPAPSPPPCFQTTARVGRCAMRESFLAPLPPDGRCPLTNRDGGIGRPRGGGLLWVFYVGLLACSIAPRPSG